MQASWSYLKAYKYHDSQSLPQCIHNPKHLPAQILCTWGPHLTSQAAFVHRLSRQYSAVPTWKAKLPPQHKHRWCKQHFHLHQLNRKGAWEVAPPTHALSMTLYIYVSDAHKDLLPKSGLWSRLRQPWENVLHAKIIPGSRGCWKAPSWAGLQTRFK